MSGVTTADSTEFNAATNDPVIHTMTDQIGKEGTGGTMRLGNYECTLKKGSLAQKLYKKQTINERHRHRYEFNSKYTKALESTGMVVSGVQDLGDISRLSKGLLRHWRRAQLQNPRPANASCTFALRLHRLRLIKFYVGLPLMYL